MRVREGAEAVLNKLRIHFSIRSELKAMVLTGVINTDSVLRGGE